MACSVVVVEDFIADELVEKLIQKANEIKIGNGLDEGIFLGQLFVINIKTVHCSISKQEKKKVRSLYEMEETMRELGVRGILSALQSLTM